MNKLNLYMSAVTTGSAKDSDILSLAIVSDEGKLYMEFTDIELPKILTDTEQSSLYKKMKFSEIEYYKTHDEENKLTIIKGHSNEVYKVMEDFLLDLSMSGNRKLNFVVMDPVLWFLFINKFFPYKNEIPIIPEFIDPYPVDLISAIKFSIEDIEDEDLIIKGVLDASEKFDSDSLEMSLFLSSFYKKNALV